ncbi:MAG: hypothetical protein HYR56_33685 [Acidobacteria bacterium]|nr:hypothetical protein [Acidobacteriota bacterium]MBI3427385.1 hypothetical protein [Acidobacteriota bacterium]
MPDEVSQRLERQARAPGTTTAETVARLIEEIEAPHLTDVVRQMRVEGLFAKPPAIVPPLPADFQPIQVQGQPLSEVIIEERR